MTVDCLVLTVIFMTVDCLVFRLFPRLLIVWCLGYFHDC